MNELVPVPTAEYGGLMPIMSVDQAWDRYRSFEEFKKRIMVEGVDFGVVPGTSGKPVLLKPGAEKLTTFFGLTVRFEVIEKVEDWTGDRHNGEQFFYYWYRCSLHRGELLIGEGDGSCNSMEPKYRWRWVSESDLPPGYDVGQLRKRAGSITEFAFAVDNSETTGQYAKPQEHWGAFHRAIEAGTAQSITKTTRAGKIFDAWQIDTTVYRIPNEDIAGQVNTLKKMAQKRALVAATLIVVNASQYFTQDLEDMDKPPIEHAESTSARPSQQRARKDEPRQREAQHQAGRQSREADFPVKVDALSVAKALEIQRDGTAFADLSREQLAGVVNEVKGSDKDSKIYRWAARILLSDTAAQYRDQEQAETEAEEAQEPAGKSWVAGTITTLVSADLFENSYAAVGTLNKSVVLSVDDPIDIVTRWALRYRSERGGGKDPDAAVEAADEFMAEVFAEMEAEAGKENAQEPAKADIGPEGDHTDDVVSEDEIPF